MQNKNYHTNQVHSLKRSRATTQPKSVCVRVVQRKLSQIQSSTSGKEVIRSLACDCRLNSLEGASSTSLVTAHNTAR